MTNTIKKFIQLLLILATFVTGFAAFGNITTHAYNNRDYKGYLLDCPHSDPYYCSYSNIPRTADNCYTYEVNYCNNYTTVSNNQNMPTNCTFVISSCYYQNTGNCKYFNNQNCLNIDVNESFDYCAYLNNKQCQNIIVDQPKTNNYPNQPLVDTPNYTDPIRNCALNTDYCYGNTVNSDSYYALQDNTPITNNTPFIVASQPDSPQSYYTSYDNDLLGNNLMSYTIPDYYAFDPYYNS